MKILVTGGLGFIGSHTVVELQNQGFEVVAIDNLSNSSIEVLEGIERITGKKPIFGNIDLREKSSVQNFFKKYQDIVGVIVASYEMAEPFSGIGSEMVYQIEFMFFKERVDHTIIAH